MHAVSVASALRQVELRRFVLRQRGTTHERACERLFDLFLRTAARRGAA